MLRAYLIEHAKGFPQRFQISDAVSVLVELEPLVQASTRRCADRLQELLKRHDVRLKRVKALEVAAHLQGQGSWVETQLRSSQSETKLEVVGSDFESDTFDSWSAAVEHLGACCISWLKAHPNAQVLSVSVSKMSLGVLGLEFAQPAEREPTQDFVGEIRIHASPDGGIGGSFAPIERLRRRLEDSEPRRAVLDGFAILRLLFDGKPRQPGPLGSATPEEGINSELVLLRQDNPLMPANFEIGRGSEIACWHQLERALSGMGDDVKISVDVEEGGWECGEARFVWELNTLRPNDAVPALIRKQLSVEESTQLLRRYWLAKTILAAPMPAQDEARRLDIFSTIPKECRLHPGRVRRDLAAIDLTWEAFCDESDLEPLPLEAPVSLAHFLDLAERLGLDSPDSLLALPSRHELVSASEDRLRMLAPRVHRLRYRAPRDLDSDRAQRLQDVMGEFQSSLSLRNGFMQMANPLPQLVYADDGADMLNQLWEMELGAYICVMPNLTRFPDYLLDKMREIHKKSEEEARKAGLPNRIAGARSYALGWALFVDITCRLRS
jgi:hypothetical protein